MTRAVVVYRSEYGSTQQYAQWLAVDLWCDVFDRRNIQLEDLQEYDTIIYGAPLRAGGKVPGRHRRSGSRQEPSGHSRSVDQNPY